MGRIARWLLSGLLITALSCTAVWAQATAQISGTVKDQSGAVLPGVEITATQTGTGAMRTAVTNETGSFVLPSLPVEQPPVMLLCSGAASRTVGGIAGAQVIKRSVKPCDIFRPRHRKCAAELLLLLPKANQDCGFDKESAAVQVRQPVLLGYARTQKYRFCSPRFD